MEIRRQTKTDTRAAEREKEKCFTFFKKHTHKTITYCSYKVGVVDLQDKVQVCCIYGH